MRFLPLAAILAFIAIAFGWRAWLQSRRYGTSGILLFRSTRRGQMVRDSLTLVWFAVLIGQAAAAMWPEWLARRALLASPAGPAADILGAIGVVLLVAGLVLMVTAQLELGASWRIGIDSAARPGLVTSGIYRYSRNPIFLAFLVILVGYALLIPTALSLALLIGTYVGVRGQIAAEEAYLEHAYGEAYRDYAGRVGRFVPGIGRRR
jgi:protein-S-isoprenylcysteine O-methyltransferase Ste14